MSIKTLKQSICKANEICEAAAAAVAELTDQMKPKPTTFSIPSEGINYGQLVTELRNNVSPTVKISKVDDTIVITTTNEQAVAKSLGLLGISVEVDGTLNNQ